jgi:hypothetical protein
MKRQRGLSLLGLFLYSLAISQPAACFNLPNTYSLSSNPQNILSDDINMDGKVDLIIINPAAYVVSVLLGNNTGTFSAPNNYFTGALPFLGTINDFNSDGKKDIATCNLSNMSILTATAAGSFSTATNYSTFSNPSAIVSNDFSGDSKPDIAIAFQGTPALSVFINNGTGSFGSGASYSLTGNALAMCSKDFNLDSKKDLAILSPPNIISVFIAGAAGIFGTSVNYTVNGTNHIVSEDFDNDGYFDIALAQASSSCVALMKGSPTGTFAAPVVYTVGTSPYLLTSGDFNLDGKLDLASVNSVTNANISIIAGDGSGAFSKIATFSVSSHPDDITSGDYNNDGRKDIATCKYTNKDYSVFLNCLGVSINEGITNDLFKVYPNPSSGNYFIDVEAAIRLTVYNSLGQLVTEVVFDQGRNVISLLDYPSGIYYLNFESAGQEKYKSLKLIKE